MCSERGRSTMSHWTFGSAELHEMSMELRLDGVPSPLPARSLAVLAHLLRASGQPVTRSELIAAVWGDQHVKNVSCDAVGETVNKLRTALTGENRKFIVTERGGQWRFDSARVGFSVAEVQRYLTGPTRQGQTVPNSAGFVLEKRLGQGTDTEAWLARRPADGATRVFKLTDSDTGRAAVRLALTQHLNLRQKLGDRPDILRVCHWSLEQLPCFQTYEHAGQDLAGWAAQGHLRTMRPAERLRTFCSIAAPVAAAHNVGVLHRALTPGNILVSGAPHDWQMKVGDFGSSTLLDSTFLKRGRETAPASTTAAPRSAYLAPELREGAPMTQKSDVFSLGVILYQLVVGDLRRTFTPGWGAEMDAGLREVIGTATHPDPGRRTATVETLVNGLRSWSPAPAHRAAPRLRLVASALATPASDHEAGRGSSHATRAWHPSASLAAEAGSTDCNMSDSTEDGLTS